MGIFSDFFRKDRRPKLDVTHPQVVALSEKLRKLHAMPIGTAEEIAAWEAAAEKLSERLYEDYKDVYDSLPHEIEHYLVDVDIRAKDPGYAQYQEKMLADLLLPPRK